MAYCGDNHNDVWYTYQKIREERRLEDEDKENARYDFESYLAFLLFIIKFIIG